MLSAFWQAMAGYTPVMTSKDSDTEGGNATSCWTDHLIMWTSIGTLFSSLITLLMVALNIVNFTSSMHGSPIVQAGQPSQYIHLDSVFRNNHDRNTSHHTSIVNFPDIVAQIEARSLDRLVQEDTSRQWRTPLGTVFPEDRHVIVSSEASTVLQFFHLDYGMEYCSLALSIPPPSDGFDPEAKLENDTVVDVWLLQSNWSDRLIRASSGEIAPKRKTLVASVPIRFGEPFVTDRFRCRSGELSLFELSCSPSSAHSCHVEFWQNGEISPHAGAYITQECSLERGEV
ncbi:uncharacterized protein EV420DRAFT_254861 [Desarmillaria tabescens]|uniref:Ubiquitin 3 binding protein But2 C-terminal domain-containing protein n=1 Tax=Armillaria tabescens TaxID=1929756 RepID=A0AA39KIX8_ARMTA|nr:uncharacterized protein EV420DRAFT_254861 [Desarmillaria tabescens]KAK0460183.1 hypothetical protein EV420DRAFT_254861 [Desarmillaria tabescens]